MLNERTQNKELFACNFCGGYFLKHELFKIKKKLTPFENLILKREEQIFNFICDKCAKGEKKDL